MAFAHHMIGRWLRRFRRSEDGGPTLEFVIVFMPFMMLAVSAFELGLLMTRHVMLERGLDMAVREVRLNTGLPVNEHQFKVMVCNSAGILPNCMNQLRLEMIAVDLRVAGSVGPATVRREASCVDYNDPFLPARTFNNGIPNQMMVVRACARLAPMLPETALGYFLSRMDNGFYRLVSSTAFVMEPI
ncbi:TadE/TadG family type IV pilus assembly protein [Thalassorhabdomicrobium marinisediminis]|uniref:Pilus assembly protein n=1 Tax=Thalassorhabdomicrobium marinisediminis TaxID=2170577 RepID=A0A2T7FWP2_9RHOB|nr:pilus assembly protein [Thalassorhabdomicrobium marinisediminis]PVA06574.1 pilus assembly protein [Thalassorhabdomicrobium marinisediminis]